MCLNQWELPTYTNGYAHTAGRAGARRPRRRRSMSVLYHLAPAPAWRACREAGEAFFPESYGLDGFIHLTEKAELLLPVANHFYRGDTRAWLLLVLDAGKLKAEVKMEPAADVGTTKTTAFEPGAETVPLFPHLYGTIDYGAVAQEVEVQRDAATGEFLAFPGLK